MNQELLQAYKKLDVSKQNDNDVNVHYILEKFSNWNKRKDSEELKRVIEAFIDVQYYIIELQRDRDLAMRAIVQYKTQRNTLIDENNNLKKQIKRYEDKHNT